MEAIPSPWIPVFAMLLIQVVGVAVYVGVMKQSLQFLREEIEKLWTALREHNSRLNDHDARLARTEAVCDERHGPHHQPARPARSKP